MIGATPSDRQMETTGSMMMARAARGHWPHSVIAFPTIVASLAIVASPIAFRPAWAQPASTELRAALEEFWTAPDVEARDRLAAAIAGLDPGFEVVYDLVREGRSYSGDVQTGVVTRSRRNADGTEHLYALIIPEDYDPLHRYPVRVHLHGGVSRPAWSGDEVWWRRSSELASDSVIVAVPTAWRESPWWRYSQIENLAGMLGELKRDYNVDENRISLWGVSDGGSGAYYHAFTAPMAWAAILPLIGSPGVLGNPDNGVDATPWVANLANRPLYIVNGELDPLYPAAGEEGYMALFEQAGVEFVFRTMEGYGHNLDWWPEEAAAMEEFVAAHPRDPLPDRLVWETDRSDRYNRVDWLVITELASPRAGDAEQGGPVDRPARVELERNGDTVRVRTSDVRRYTLLISPEQFDLSRPVVIETNGRTSFRGRVAPSVETLLEWTGRDDDRTRLFAAELEIDTAIDLGPGGT
jgi:predicted esterase